MLLNESQGSTLKIPPLIYVEVIILVARRCITPQLGHNPVIAAAAQKPTIQITGLDGTTQLKVFVPLDDHLLERLDGSEMPVPYQPGMVIWSHVEVLSEREYEAAATNPASVHRQHQHPIPLPDRH